jgi:hypothetical protein
VEDDRERPDCALINDRGGLELGARRLRRRCQGSARQGKDLEAPLFIEKALERKSCRLKRNEHLLAHDVGLQQRVGLAQVNRHEVRHLRLAEEGGVKQLVK